MLINGVAHVVVDIPAVNGLVHVIDQMIPVSKTFSGCCWKRKQTPFVFVQKVNLFVISVE